MNEFSKHARATQIMLISDIVKEYTETHECEMVMENFIYEHLATLGGDDVDAWNHDDITVDIDAGTVTIEHEFTYTTYEDDEPEEDEEEDAFGPLPDTPSHWIEEGVAIGGRGVYASPRSAADAAPAIPRNSLRIVFADGGATIYENISHHSYDSCGEKVILRVHTKDEGVMAFPSERIHSTSFQRLSGGVEG